MTPPSSGLSVFRIAGITCVALIALGFAATLLVPKSDLAKSHATNGSIRVVTGNSDGNARLSGPPSNLIAAAPAINSADALQALVNSSFPALENVTTRCADYACEIKATTNVPEGDREFSAYEKMIRTEIPAIIQQKGFKAGDALQIEEISNAKVGLRIHVRL